MTDTVSQMLPLHANCPTLTTRKGIWNIIFGFSCFGNIQESSMVVIFLKIPSRDEKNTSKVTIYSKNNRSTLLLHQFSRQDMAS